MGNGNCCAPEVLPPMTGIPDLSKPLQRTGSMLIDDMKSSQISGGGRRSYRQSLPQVATPVVNQRVSQRLSQTFYVGEGAERGTRKPSVQFPDGSVYDGQWKNDQPHGAGMIHLPNGSVFEGVFINGLAKGKGRLITAEGDIYQGTILDGKADGFGSYQSADTKTKYEGQFKDNLPHGKGKMTDQVSTFEGTFENGFRKYGKLRWGIKGEYEYEGPFHEELFWGEGVLKAPHGVFKGSFVAGKKHENGVFEWTDGRKYIGRYINDVKNGNGVLYNSDGTVSYNGSWYNDLPNGYGEGFVDGKIFKGYWKHGKIDLPRKYPD